MAPTTVTVAYMWQDTTDLDHENVHLNLFAANVTLDEKVGIFQKNLQIYITSDKVSIKICNVGKPKHEKGKSPQYE